MAPVILLLRDLIQAGRADLQTGPFGTMLHASSYLKHGVPVVAVKNIGENVLLDDDLPRISEKDAQRLDRYSLRENDILFSRKGSVERRAIVRAHEAGWLQGSDCIRLRFDDSIDSRFVSFFLGTSQAKTWLVRHATGATMPSLNQNILGLLPIPCPTLENQRAIAGILGALDDKIEVNRRMNQTLEEIARTIFTSWFVRFDPVRAKADGRPPEGMDAETAALFPHAFIDSALGPIPAGWKTMELGQICSRIFSGGTPRTNVADFWQGDIPWLSSGETRNHFIIDTEKQISELGVSSSSTRLARSGSIVIASAGQGHTRGQTSYLSFDSYVNQSVVVLEANPEVSSDLFLYFDLANRYEQFRQLSDGHSSRGSLTTKLLSSLGVVLPPANLVNAFNAVTQTLVDCIVLNLRESVTITEIRDALLPKLLSGELRVPEAERTLAEVGA